MSWIARLAAFAVAATLFAFTPATSVDAGTVESCANLWDAVYVDGVLDKDANDAYWACMDAPELATPEPLVSARQSTTSDVEPAPAVFAGIGRVLSGDCRRHRGNGDSGVWSHTWQHGG